MLLWLSGLRCRSGPNHTQITQKTIDYRQKYSFLSRCTYPCRYYGIIRMRICNRLILIQSPLLMRVVIPHQHTLLFDVSSHLNHMSSYVVQHMAASFPSPHRMHSSCALADQQQNPCDSLISLFLCWWTQDNVRWLSDLPAENQEVGLVSCGVMHRSPIHHHDKLDLQVSVPLVPFDDFPNTDFSVR